MSGSQVSQRRASGEADMSEILFIAGRVEDGNPSLGDRRKIPMVACIVKPVIMNSCAK